MVMFTHIRFHFASLYMKTKYTHLVPARPSKVSNSTICYPPHLQPNTQHMLTVSAGSVEGSALVSSTLTLARAPPALADYEPARHAPPASLASLDRRYVPTYVGERIHKHTYTTHIAMII